MPLCSISSADEYPIHQNAQPVRFVGTSDRNFYDRAYFNCHACSDQLFLILGMGQYPNLGTQDAFAAVRRGDQHHVVRASRELDDRNDLGVGPFRVEVVKPLERIRVVLEPNEFAIAFELEWRGSIPVIEEPRHFLRSHGRVLFDTCRFSQTGRWSGWLQVAGEEFQVEPGSWWGNRDRSWGVRPIGEAEAPGIREGELAMQGMWNYSPMQFADHTILYLLHEDADGIRHLEEARRVWCDPTREAECLGRPEYTHKLISGTRVIEASTLHFPEAPNGGFDVNVTPLLACGIGVGTGYGLDADWRHGMYQGKLVVQGKSWDHETVWPLSQYAVIDHVARFEYAGQVGYGLHEHGFFGCFPKYGMQDAASGAR